MMAERGKPKHRTAGTTNRQASNRCNHRVPGRSLGFTRSQAELFCYAIMGNCAAAYPKPAVLFLHCGVTNCTWVRLQFENSSFWN